MPLDEFLPDYHVNEVHSTRVRATPEAVLAAARAVTAREIPLMVALMALRSLPRLVMPRRSDGRRLHRSEPVLDQFLGGGFALLADRPDELVVGGVGRFWKPSGDVRRVGAADFAEFAEPGYAKAAFNMHVQPAPDGATLLTTETRIQGTDDEARRSFRRYWLVIHPGSAAIRHAWLRAIRRRAES